VLEKPDEDILAMVKDITRFKNRGASRSLLADPQPINFLMAPENAMPLVPYTAEHLPENGEKDNYLLSLIEELEELRVEKDVRNILDERY
jgi:hypothetical protein